MHSEQAFHDRQADQRSATYRADPAALLVSDAAYLDHEPWIRPAFARLGDLRGLDVLDAGCGHGRAAALPPSGSWSLMVAGPGSPPAAAASSRIPRWRRPTRPGLSLGSGAGSAR